MMFMSLMIVSTILFLVGVSTVIGFILLINSTNLSRKSRKAETLLKYKSNKLSAKATLIISIIFFIPYGLLRNALIASEIKQEYNENKKIEAIENKVYVDREEWKKGFEYDGKKLVPLSIRDNYQSMGYSNSDLNEIGALVINNTTSYNILYEVNNDSGHDIYYVHEESSIENYSTTFVDENDYDFVMEYYDNSDLKIRVLWETAPKYTRLSNIIVGLDLKIDNDEWMQLTHEMLDDTSKNESGITSVYDEEKAYYDEIMEFKINSPDNVIATTLNVFVKGDEMTLSFNGYNIDDEIMQEHKDMFMSLINDSQEELLQMAEEDSEDDSENE